MCLFGFLSLVGPPYTLRLKVKFYSSEPNNLREELTRYQFFLQLKQDILEGRLDCPHQTAVELAALALQCKLQIRLLAPLILKSVSNVVKTMHILLWKNAVLALQRPFLKGIDSSLDSLIIFVFIYIFY